MTGDSVHLDLMLAADEEIDRQLDIGDPSSPVETIVWRQGLACPRGAFEARALQRGFLFVRPIVAAWANRTDWTRETRWQRVDHVEY